MPTLEQQHPGRRGGWIVKWQDKVPGSTATIARNRWFWRKSEAMQFIKKKWPKKKKGRR
jgi:hypothetical protein